MAAFSRYKRGGGGGGGGKQPCSVFVLFDSIRALLFALVFLILLMAPKS